MIDDIGAITGGIFPRVTGQSLPVVFRYDLAGVKNVHFPFKLNMHNAQAGEENERILRTPVEPFTADSKGNVTKVSTCSGAMPWASVRIVTVGALRSGNTSGSTETQCKYPKVIAQ